MARIESLNIKVHKDKKNQSYYIRTSGILLILIMLTSHLMYPLHLIITIDVDKFEVSSLGQYFHT